MDEKSFRTGVLPDGQPVKHGGFRENQRTIAIWADSTFGPASSVMRIAARANEEMAELLQAVAPMGGVLAVLAGVNMELAKALRKASISEERELQGPEKAATVMKAADVTIVLMRLAEVTGYDLLGCVDQRMVMNRTRQWRRDGTGHGYHTKDGGN